jgi:hypothetical protein
MEHSTAVIEMQRASSAYAVATATGGAGGLIQVVGETLTPAARVAHGRPRAARCAAAQ